MTIWFHTTVLATTLAATAAIGFAGAAVYSNSEHVGSKGDRLQIASNLIPVQASCDVASLDGFTCVSAAPSFVTFEQRFEGGSVLTRVPVAN